MVAKRAYNQPRIQGWWTGAKVEAEGVGFREGVPLPQKFFEFLSRNGAILCILQQ